MKKVSRCVATFGIAGACRRDELQKISIEDIEEVGSILIVKVPRSKTDKEQSFIITNTRNYVPIIFRLNVFFINYRNEKCTVQAIGVNTFAKIPYAIAQFLHLENPELYTGLCFRRSSATLLADTGADILELKRQGGWKSSTVAEGYVEESLANKLNVAKQIFPPGENDNVQIPSASTFREVTN
ncbi:hypothetical protein NQ317_000437 [Molorchus minor]|uniref:Tyr recombinase domain-containing protein n=1 Tax=Molorchus minor TaxID=1323400 RepID=A0ABQ9J7A1_9CUCU|nr:hypothetical protein NQ317_000437 [Molorchus minor]